MSAWLIFSIVLVIALGYWLYRGIRVVRDMRRMWDEIDALSVKLGQELLPRQWFYAVHNVIFVFLGPIGERLLKQETEPQLQVLRQQLARAQVSCEG